MSQQHTPTPWKAVGRDVENEDGLLLASAYTMPDNGVRAGPINANFIVRACNSHAALVNALQLITDKVEGQGGGLIGFRDEVSHAKAALALERGAS